MKWPSNLVIIRHAQSAYNALRAIKERDLLYQKFVSAFKRNHRSAEAIELAEVIKDRYALKHSDYETPLSVEGQEQARRLGKQISTVIPPPDIIFVSPYKRTRDTLGAMVEGGFPLGEQKVVLDDRIREQEHGLSLLYSDWRVFQTFHPEQKDLYKMMGPYWYQYPQGESVCQVRDRIRHFTNMLVRECAGLTVYLISHHLTKLSIRANLERMRPEEFIRLDREDKPINCGVTIYDGKPELGTDGRLVLMEYNKKLY